MLSRVADAVYWMSRYIERAENIARFVDVNEALTLDHHLVKEAAMQPEDVLLDPESFLQRVKAACYRIQGSV